MEIKPEELIHILKQHKPLPKATQIIVVVGSEDYYRTQISKYIPEYVCSGIPEDAREITVFEKDTNLRELEGVINTPPFFSEKSLVILRDEKLWDTGKEKSKDGEKEKISETRKKQMDQLTKILGDVPEYCMVYLVAQNMDKRTKLYKDLKEKALVANCDSVKVRDIAPWLNARAQELGGRFEYDAIPAIMDYLAAVDEAPLALLSQEIEKLAVFVGERKTWTKQDVETIFSALPEAAFYALNNFIAERKLVEALTLIADEKKKGKPVILLCGGVMAQLRKMLRIKELVNQGYGQKEIADELKIHPYVAKINMQQVKYFSLEQLLEALLEIGQLNKDLRKGGRDYARLEEILIKLIGK